MKDLKLFTQSELSTLETLDIMGGTASAEASQTGCSNNVVGCNCTIIQVPFKSHLLVMVQKLCKNEKF